MLISQFHATSPAPNNRRKTLATTGSATKEPDNYHRSQWRPNHTLAKGKVNIGLTVCLPVGQKQLEMNATMCLLKV